MVDLGVLGGPFTQSTAVAVNARGAVVGNSYSMDGGEAHGFMWTASGGLIDVGSLGGNTYVSALNKRGQVVGSSDLPESSGPRARDAFVWTRADGTIDLGTLPGGHYRISGATAVSARGDVVGASYTFGDTQHATLWRASRHARPSVSR